MLGRYTTGLCALLVVRKLLKYLAKVSLMGIKGFLEWL